jgi:hypothetical protein
LPVQGGIIRRYASGIILNVDVDFSMQQQAFNYVKVTLHHGAMQRRPTVILADVDRGSPVYKPVRYFPIAI